MRRKSNARNTYNLPELSKVSLKVSNGNLCIIFSPKHVFPLGADCAADMTEKDFPKLYREGYKPLFIALSLYPKGEVGEIRILFKETKHLRNPKPAVQHTQGDDMRPPQILPSWLKVKKAVNVSRRKRG